MRLFLIFLSLIYVVGASYAQRFKTGLSAACDPQGKILAFDPSAEPGLKNQVLPETAAQRRPDNGGSGVFRTDRRCRG